MSAIEHVLFSKFRNDKNILKKAFSPTSEQLRIARRKKHKLNTYLRENFKNQVTCSNCLNGSYATTHDPKNLFCGYHIEHIKHNHSCIDFDIETNLKNLLLNN